MISYCKKLLKNENLNYLTGTEAGTNSVHLNKIPFLNGNQFGTSPETYIIYKHIPAMLRVGTYQTPSVA